MQEILYQTLSASTKMTTGPEDIVHMELGKLVLMISTEPAFLGNSGEMVEFHLKLSRCVADCQQRLRARDVSFISDLLSVVIKCLRFFAERGEPDEIGCMPYYYRDLSFLCGAKHCLWNKYRRLIKEQHYTAEWDSTYTK